MVLDNINKEECILITGATGFVGSYILRYLVHEGFTDIKAIHRSSSRFDLIEEVKEKVTWVEADLSDQQRLDEAVKGASNVIHAAAMVSFDEADKHSLMAHNYEGTQNVVNACLHYNVKKLVHLSSIAAISKPTTGNIIDEETEWVETGHTTPYARSKYAAEMEVRRGEAEGLSIAILNPSLILGAGYWENSSVKIFKSMTKGQLFYPLGGTGFVDVRDVAKIAIKLLSPAYNGRRFIVNGANWSFLKMMTTMAVGYDIREPRWPLAKWLIPLSWRALAIVSFLTRKKSIYTKQSVINSSQKWTYNNSRSITEIGHKYLDLEQTIHQTCKLYLISEKLNKDYHFLKLN